ncbi:MmgE/PrpD family protein [Paraburkholderia sp. J41]|uniref:MmgE/PrpD family protein n=1 Tax=Paraburkholderia sp. J41 TaxID=2805433 RepID=UPI002AC33DF3|nr:MmgE/PrpD family protein [Paraburkholderia sp. J41]
MNTSHPESTVSIADQIGDWIATLAAAGNAGLPPAAADTARLLLLDVTGLCIAGRREPYIDATLAATDRDGRCTALGHTGGFNAFEAALVNGTAAHGEDYDDTFEGGPVHSGAVVVPAVLAACEREGLGGEALLRGIVAGAELMCRLSLVAPRAIHSAGFHPTAVIGALAAAAGVSAALRLDARAATSALGIAGSMASGIIEYLAEGTSTKRMHAGWAAQSGIRAALMARGGFDGPRTVLEGKHGFFKAFAPSRAPDFAPVLDGLGTRWIMETIAFKPYACGTMTQPYIDCAIALAERGVQAAQIREIVCDVGEGTVHRLWEELAVKHRPPTAYAAKFSTPFCMAVGFFDRKAGFEQFTEARIRDAQVLALAAKIRYRIDPENAYPNNFTGHLRATLADGSVIEIRQPHMRGGAHEPLSKDELSAKFFDNVRYGGWDAAQAEAARAWCERAFDERAFASLAQFRQ